MASKQLSEDVPELALDLGTYDRENVTNVGTARDLFDKGLGLLFSYQHEEAAKAFLQCVEVSPYCALAHALIALSHSPNYNLNGVDFYKASKNQVPFNDYPNQVLASYHSQEAIKIIERLAFKGRRRKQRRNRSSSSSSKDFCEMELRSISISNVEEMVVKAVWTLNNSLKIESSIADQKNERLFANEMRTTYQKYPDDPEVAYFYAESLMTLNSWKLYDYPAHRQLSNDVQEVNKVLEDALYKHPKHVGLCHMYVHLCEMSPNPEKALMACEVLRKR